MFLESDLERAINKATTNAIIQAIVIPCIIFAVLFIVKRDIAGFSFLYWMLPSIVYVFSGNRDIARKIFFRIVASIIAVMMMFIMLIIS